MNFFLSAFLCLYIAIHAVHCESVKEMPYRYVSVRTLDNKNINGQFLIKRDIQGKKPVLIQSGNKNLLSVKTASIDEFYDTKEFQELLKEFKLNVERSKLPNIRDVSALLGTEDGQEMLDAIKDFASTDDGLDLIKSYLANEEASDRVDVEDVSQARASKYYGEPEIEGEEGSSWWSKITSWFGLSQSTKLDSKKKDLEILSKIVPVDESLHENVKFAGRFFKPSPQAEIPINPPFKVFNSHSIKISNQPYSIDVKELPAIRMTEQQYDEFIKSGNLMNPGKLAKYDKSLLNKDFSFNHFDNSDVKRSFTGQSQPVRHSSYNPPTGYLFKAHPDEIDKISKILSEKIAHLNEREVALYKEVSQQQHS